MAQNQPNLILTLIITLLTISSTYGDPDGDVLIQFKNALSSESGLLSDWHGDNPTPCTGDTPNWTGIRCRNGSVFGLRLENMTLKGTIDIDLLAKLRGLRTLSFMNNSFDGPIPDVKRLSLRAVYLSYNNFSGEIADDAFENMRSLRKVHIARNRFTGRIPRSLSSVKKLVEVNVEGNGFADRLPDLSEAVQLRFVNFSNNRFVGRIPRSLGRFDTSAFAGNNGLCGKPLDPCKTTKKILIIVGGIIALFALIVGLTFVGLRRTRSRKQSQSQSQPHQPNNPAQDTESNINTGPNEARIVAAEGDSGELHFVRKNDDETTKTAPRFDLQDLLRSSAEVLGDGTFGSTYKALVLNGSVDSHALVVKRFRQMNSVGKREFFEHMRRLGSLSHPNLLALVAFYYRKEEKLLVSEFVANGSLAGHLHGKGAAPLDWPLRLKIIKGVSKALLYLHQEFPTLSLPHGHLKSSNVLLNETFEPLLTDYTLLPVLNKDHAHSQLVAYKSPDTKPTRKTDVWSLGIIILEMLTGKYPDNYLKQGKGTNDDLSRWVNSVVREEWTGEVFDKDMSGVRNGEGEMLKMLKIGMCCCEWNVERRWELSVAVEKIEEVKERDGENSGDCSSYVSEEYGHSSSRGLTDEDFSFSVNA